MSDGETRYVNCDGTHIAYRVNGSGTPLLLVSNFATNVEAMETFEITRHVLAVLASLFRFVVYDQRGTGLSDRAPADTNNLDTWLEDAKAVQDSAAVGPAILLGLDFSGPIAIEFAARYPERTEALILWGTFATLLATDDYGIGLPRSVRDRVVDMTVQGWGDPNSQFARWAIPQPEDDAARQAASGVQRQSVRPGELRPMVERMLDVDVRSSLDKIRCPTLVLHRRDERLIPVAHGRYLAERIPNAKLVELPGDSHYIYVGDVDRALAEVASFARAAPVPDDEFRTLAVVMFVDVVASTVRATSAGDRQWRRTLDDVERTIRDHLHVYSGRAVNWTGDGVVATFASPTRSIRCALALSDTAETDGIAFRIGLHAGEIEHRGDDIAGIGVHIAQRIESAAAAGEVLVSSTVRDLVAGSPFEFRDRGRHELKGLPGEWHLFAVGSS